MRVLSLISVFPLLFLMKHPHCLLRELHAPVQVIGQKAGLVFQELDQGGDEQPRDE
jgi:hypothetical protein